MSGTISSSRYEIDEAAVERLTAIYLKELIRLVIQLRALGVGASSDAEELRDAEELILYHINKSAVKAKLT